MPRLSKQPLWLLAISPRENYQTLRKFRFEHLETVADNPGSIDLIDEAASGVRVARDSQPELIDAFERQKLQLEVEVRALSKEKDEASKERMEKAKEEIRGIDDKLTPLRAAFDAQKQGAEQIQQLRQKIDSLKSKADRAERSYDLATAADLRHYSSKFLSTICRVRLTDECSSGNTAPAGTNGTSETN